MKVYFEYVPSKENIADAPSRYNFDLVLGLGARRVSLVFPPVAALLDPAAAYSLSIAPSLVPSQMLPPVARRRRRCPTVCRAVRVLLESGRAHPRLRHGPREVAWICRGLPPFPYVSH